jgi:hypothetical protein
MSIVIRVNCVWCGSAATLQAPHPTYCVKCRHRADWAPAMCDCLNCTARRNGITVNTAPQAPQATQADGTGIRAGRLITSVSADGVTRRLVDAEDDSRSVEIFETRARAVEVFVKVWATMTPQERFDFWAAIHDDD